MNIYYTHRHISLNNRTVESVTLGTNNLHVKMGKTTCRGQSEFDHSFHSNSVSIQVIEKGSMLMIIRHQPQLSPCTIVCASEQTQFSWAAEHLQLTQAVSTFHYHSSTHLQQDATSTLHQFLPYFLIFSFSTLLCAYISDPQTVPPIHEIKQ